MLVFGVMHGEAGAMLADPGILIHWVFIAVALGIGFALIFVPTDLDALRHSANSHPDLALYRFRAFCCGVALLCFIGAAISWFAL